MPSDSFMAGSTTSQVSPSSDKPDSQDDVCGVIKPNSIEPCDNVVELSAHSAHDKPSNKIPRLDNDANAPTLSQFECDDPEHLDIVMRKNKSGLGRNVLGLSSSSTEPILVHTRPWPITNTEF